MANESEVPGSPGKKPTLASVLVPVALVLTAVLFTLGYLRSRGKPHSSAQSPTAASSPSETGPITRSVGEVLPDLVFRTLEGGTVRLSEVKGKVIVINFWATWCGPCVKEMPSLQRLADEYASRGLVVLGVNVDEDPAKVLAPFLAKHAIKFRTFVDPDGGLAERFDVSGLPLTLVVDEHRRILFEHLGDEEWFDADYRRQFELWLKGAAAG